MTNFQIRLVIMKKGNKKYVITYNIMERLAKAVFCA